MLSAALSSGLYNERWDHFLTVFKSHLDTKGWFDKTVLYFDEISEEKALPVIDQVIIPNHPAWKIGGAITREFSAETKAKCYDLSALLGYNISSAGFENRVFTFYTSCTQLFPNSFVTRENTTAEMTWMAWHAANKNYSGYLRWAYDNWQLNDPADARDGSNTAGDFALVYRSANTGTVACYPSLRLMMLREGIQDYEKIRILKTVFQSGDQVKLQALNTVLRKFTVASGEENAESPVNEGQAVLASLSHDLSYTGIDTVRQPARELEIYPNPASGYVCIKAPEKNPFIRFFNLSGKEMHPDATGSSGNLYSYSLNNIAAGCYFVQAVALARAYHGVFIIK
jgi:hypothetical protein